MSAPDDPILIGLGANLPNPGYGGPRKTLEAAVKAFPEHGLKVVKRSAWYESSPVPPSDQPWFVNGVAVIETALRPREVLVQLLAIEQAFGRQRGEKWAARTLDLDLLAYGAEVVEHLERPGQPAVTVPHPRLQDRRFVLVPLKDVAPDWRHPVTGKTLDTLLAELLDPGEVRLIDRAKG
jgi:2-amino-4-hydroxy-6-hydroxymethyldihydropteridine diphosphokinase